MDALNSVFQVYNQSFSSSLLDFRTAQAALTAWTAHTDGISWADKMK
jgi:hypothetical protein